MAKKFKHIYGVWLATKYSIGMQPVKGNNKKEARKRFKKRYPNKMILDIARLDAKPFTTPL